MGGSSSTSTRKSKARTITGLRDLLSEPSKQHCITVLRTQFPDTNKSKGQELRAQGVGDTATSCRATVATSEAPRARWSMPCSSFAFHLYLCTLVPGVENQTTAMLDLHMMPSKSQPDMVAASAKAS